MHHKIYQHRKCHTIWNIFGAGFITFNGVNFCCLGCYGCLSPWLPCTRWIPLFLLFVFLFLFLFVYDFPHVPWMEVLLILYFGEMNNLVCIGHIGHAHSFHLNPLVENNSACQNSTNHLCAYMETSIFSGSILFWCLNVSQHQMASNCFFFANIRLWLDCDHFCSKAPTNRNHAIRFDDEDFHLLDVIASRFWWHNPHTVCVLFTRNKNYSYFDVYRAMDYYSIDSSRTIWKWFIERLLPSSCRFIARISLHLA